MKLTEMDLRISYSQAYNLAVALLAPEFASGRDHKLNGEVMKMAIVDWQKWFYSRLTTGYMEKFTPHLVPSGRDEKKIKDTAKEEAELDAD